MRSCSASCRTRISPSASISGWDDKAEISHELPVRPGNSSTTGFQPYQVVRMGIHDASSGHRPAIGYSAGNDLRCTLKPVRSPGLPLYRRLTAPWRDLPDHLIIGAQIRHHPAESSPGLEPRHRPSSPQGMSPPQPAGAGTHGNAPSSNFAVGVEGWNRNSGIRSGRAMPRRPISFIPRSPLGRPTASRLPGDRNPACPALRAWSHC